jgi:hypothetical protein
MGELGVNRDRRHGRLHSPRAERMAEKRPSPPQNIKQSHRGNRASHLDQVECEPQLKQTSVHQYVCPRSCGVAEYNKTFRSEALSEYSNDIVTKNKPPASLALNCGDDLAIRSLITIVLSCSPCIRPQGLATPFGFTL